MNILVVDDHDVIRHSLKRIIASEFPSATCSTSDNAEACTMILKNEQFDLIILDMNLPDMDGISLTEFIRTNYPEQKILIFSMNPEGIFAKKLYQMGIMGYLNKQVEMKEIRTALRTILTENKIYMSPAFKEMHAHDSLNNVNENPIEKLSKRELSIAQMMVQGKSIDEIAIALNIEASTVRTYKSRIFQKLDINTLHDFLSKAQLYNLT